MPRYYPSVSDPRSNTSISSYEADEIVVLRGEQLRHLIESAVNSALDRAIALFKEEADKTKIISGRPKIMEYLGIKQASTLRRRIKDYPQAFTEDGRSLIFNVQVYEAEIRRRQRIL